MYSNEGRGWQLPLVLSNIVSHPTNFLRIHFSFPLLAILLFNRDNEHLVVCLESLMMAALHTVN